MNLILCYDVSHNTRRARLFKRLKGFLIPVQESVFEGVLPSARWGALLDMVQRTIDPNVDSVRIYHLCKSCTGITTLLGVSPKVPDPDEPVII